MNVLVNGVVRRIVTCRERTNRGWESYTVTGFVICTLYRILYYGDPIKQDEMNGVHGAYGGEVKCI